MRNLPRLGPRSLWKMRHRLQNSDLWQTTQALCSIACAYHDMFVARNQVPPRIVNSVGWFQQASDQLALAMYEELASKVARDQKVAETIRKQLLPAATSRAQRNAGWTLLYWSLLENTSLQGHVISSSCPHSLLSAETNDSCASALSCVHGHALRRLPSDRIGGWLAEEVGWQNCISEASNSDLSGGHSAGREKAHAGNIG